MRWPKKLVLFLGLCFLASGSLLCAQSESLPVPEKHRLPEPQPKKKSRNCVKKLRN